MNVRRRFVLFVLLGITVAASVKADGLFTTRDFINPLLDIVDPTAPPATYEILLIMNDDGSADIELLDCDREVGPEFQTLRRAIAKLPKQFFIRLWTIDEYPLPGAYMTGLYKEGIWRFNSFKYLLKY